ncbi:hypothetical protein ACQEVF_47550 [Nonomuraea polychroma]|uniref:hypothetical protein n=1 Tax=Nonomuraea polychroma TaxID=46176 RepID=UPI003D944140
MRSRFSLPAGAMVLALIAPGAAVAEDGPAPGAVPLIIGDRVTLTGPGGGVLVDPGAGRTGISFVIDEWDGRLWVLPIDAAALVGRGRLDPRLFDVTTLIAFGYDGRRGDLPLIATGSGPALAGGLRSAMTAGGARVTRELDAVSGLAVRVAKQDRALLWSGVTEGGRALSGGAGTHHVTCLNRRTALFGAP